MNNGTCCENAYDGAECTDECMKMPLELLKKIVEEWERHYFGEGISFDLKDILDEAEEYVKSCARV